MLLQAIVEVCGSRKEASIILLLVIPRTYLNVIPHLPPFCLVVSVSWCLSLSRLFLSWLCVSRTSGRLIGSCCAAGAGARVGRGARPLVDCGGLDGAQVAHQVKPDAQRGGGREEDDPPA